MLTITNDSSEQSATVEPTSQADKKMPSKRKLSFLVAGDITTQLVRVEAQSSQHRSRVASNKSVSNHEIVAGAPIIEFIIRETLACQAFTRSYSKTRKFSKAVESAKLQGKKVYGLLASADQYKKKLSGIENFPRTLGKREFITLIEDRSTFDEKHFWITEQDTSQHSEKVKKIFEQPVPRNSDLLLAVSLDFERFGEKQISEYFAKIPDFETQIKALVCRINYRPNDFGPEERKNVRTISENMALFLQKLDKKSPRIAVLSTESLRSSGRSISFRIHWARTIGDILSSLYDILMDEGGQNPLAFIRHMSHVVISGYSDGALIVKLPNIESLGSITEDCFDVDFIAEPNSLEGDLSMGFQGVTRGTETLLVSSICLELATKRNEKFESKGIDSPCSTNDSLLFWKLRSAVVHGLKASRYLQAYGFYESSPDLSKLTETTWQPTSRDLSEYSRAKDSSQDVAAWLYTRHTSARYFEDFQKKFGYWKDESSNAHYPPTLPFGDIVEILSSGYPVHGSFEPMALPERAARLIAQAYSSEVNLAWKEAGWLSASRVSTRICSRQKDDSDRKWAVDLIGTPAEKTDLTFHSSRHDKPWWSLREAFMDSFIKKTYRVFGVDIARAEASKTSGVVDDEVIQIDKQLSMIVSEAILRFGHSAINRKDDSLKGAFDFKVLAVLLHRMVQNTLFGYGTKDYSRIRADNAGDLPLKILALIYYSLLAPYKVPVEIKDIERDKDFQGLKKSLGLNPTSNLGAWEVSDWIKFLLKVPESAGKKGMECFDWLNKPVFGSLYGMMSEFTIGYLTSIDRRDSQFYREIFERTSNHFSSHRSQPLNILVCGPAGSGKSFAVKEIIPEAVGRQNKHSFLEYNLAQFSGAQDLAEAFLEIQDVGLSGRIPVVFWDEYDTYYQDKLGWLSFFLGPMQDGKFFHRQKSRSLPRSVFIFAGSQFNSFGEMIALDLVSSENVSYKDVFSKEIVEEMRRWVTEEVDAEFSLNELVIGRFSTSEWLKAKGPDFKSRITCNLDIGTIGDLPKTVILHGSDQLSANLNLVQSANSGIFRRSSTLRTTCERNAPGLFAGGKPDKSELQISLPIIDALIGCDSFEHGRRSLDSIIQMSSLRDRGSLETSVTPTGAQVRGHLRPWILEEGYSSRIMIAKLDP